MSTKLRNLSVAELKSINNNNNNNNNSLYFLTR